MMAKITNQYMLEGLPTGKGGFLCKCCGDKFTFDFPIGIKEFNVIAKSFESMHKIKGCNKTEIKPTKNES